MNSTLTASRASLLGSGLSGSEPPKIKRIKLEGSLGRSSLSGSSLSGSSPHLASDECAPSTAKDIVVDSSRKQKSEPQEQEEEKEISRAMMINVDCQTSKESILQDGKDDIASSGGPMVSPEHRTRSGSSDPSLVATATSKSNGTAVRSDSSAELSVAPTKANRYHDLKEKYLPELEYMLREFQKLERQLLGARSIQTVESAGSRERREKLHSFIVHLQETIEQIQAGHELEIGSVPDVTTSSSGNTTFSKPAPVSGTLEDRKSSASSGETEEENVQKLEEHILANLLPVKVRLKKQLAAQQGARHNPAGMPVRGVVEESSSTASIPAIKDTSSIQQAEVASATSGVSTTDGSSAAEVSALTRNIYGRAVNGGVNNTNPIPTPEDDGIANSTKASSFIDSSVKEKESSEASAKSSNIALLSSPQEPHHTEARQSNTSNAIETVEKTTVGEESDGDCPVPDESEPVVEDRRRRKRRRKKGESSAESQGVTQSGKRKKETPGSKNRGPRSVEYICALCNEVYNSTCDFNPWWSLQQHDCPKCRKSQIPRLDIGSPANAIEYHPALLAHAEDNGGAAATHTNPMVMPPSHLKANFSTDGSMSDSDESDLSDEDGLMSDSNSIGSEESSIALNGMSPAEQAENERFGAEYAGPVLSDEQASGMLVLMLHASTCPCRHQSPEHRDVCLSVKWMMLHIRDCPATTPTFDVCPFPWCRKMKHFLYHLVSCTEQNSCKICSPSNLADNLSHLQLLNHHRFKQLRKALVENIKNPESGVCKKVPASRTATDAKSKKTTNTDTNITHITKPPAIEKALNEDIATENENSNAEFITLSASEACTTCDEPKQSSVVDVVPECNKSATVADKIPESQDEQDPLNSFSRAETPGSEDGAAVATSTISNDLSDSID